MSCYPDWLGRRLIEDEFDWPSANSTSMPRFLSQYSLHDSYWIGIHVQPNFETIAVLRWDTFWTEGRVPFPGSTVEEWPVLLIQFERLYQLHSSYLWPTVSEEWKPTETVASAESVLVTKQDQEKMLAWLALDERQPEELKRFVLEDELYHTTFHPIYGGRIDVKHGSATKLLCYDFEENQLNIPNL